MAKSTKHIVGAYGGKKKGFPRRQKVTPKYPGRGSVALPDKKPMPRKPLPQPSPEPLPYYPETGSNKRPGGITEETKQTIIKLWEDRNRSNNNTKLNP